VRLVDRKAHMIAMVSNINYLASNGAFYVPLSSKINWFVKLLGHSGVIKLPATVFSPYFIKEVVQLLNQICPGCYAPRKNRDSKVCKIHINLIYPD
jgi:hypothetical protein